MKGRKEGRLQEERGRESPDFLLTIHAQVDSYIEAELQRERERGRDLEWSSKD